MRWLIFLTSCLLLQNAILPAAVGAVTGHAEHGHCSGELPHQHDATTVCTMDCQCPLGGGSAMASAIESFSALPVRRHARFDPPQSTGINRNYAPFRPPRLS